MLQLFLLTQSVCLNFVRFFIYYFGVKIPPQYDDKGRWSRPFIAWLFDLKMPVQNATVMLRHQMSQFIYVLGMKRNSEAWLRQLSKSETYKKQTDLLMTVPGIAVSEKYATTVFWPTEPKQSPYTLPNLNY